VTKVVPGILPVHWDTIGAFSEFKLEIYCFLAFLQIFKEGQKQGEMPYIGILVFLAMFGVL